MKWLISGLILFLMAGTIKAPTHSIVGWKTDRVLHNYRITAYSSKQPREGNKTATNKCAKNEIGFATPRNGSIKLGEYVRLPNNEIRIADDKTSKWASRKFKGRLIDVRYYQSIKSKPETKSVTKELCRRFDMGRDDIEIVKPIYRED